MADAAVAVVEVVVEVCSSPMMDATEPVMESLQVPIRTEDEVSQDARAISRIECAMLVERFQNGEISAFDEIVDRYRRYVYRLAYQFSHNCEDAYDISQEVFIKVLKSLGNLRNGSVFNTWLRRITLNTCIDYLRQRPDEQVLDDLSYLNYKHIAGNYSDSPDGPVEAGELGNVIFRAVGQLPKQQRKAFILRYYEDLSIKEIAKTLNRSQGAVKAHLFHATRRLRKLLLPYVSQT